MFNLIEENSKGVEPAAALLFVAGYKRRMPAHHHYCPVGSL